MKLTKTIVALAAIASVSMAMAVPTAPTAPTAPTCTGTWYTGVVENAAAVCASLKISTYNTAAQVSGANAYACDQFYVQDSGTGNYYGCKKVRGGACSSAAKPCTAPASPSQWNGSEPPPTPTTAS